MNPPKVSVVLPFVAERAWLSEAVQSMLQQTLSDFELLLIDNGNDTESRIIAKEHASVDDRIRILSEPEKGIAAALNHGIRSARGRFIARMDADDIAHPERLSNLVDLLETNPDIGVVSSKVELFPLNGDNGGFLRHVEWINGIISSEDHASQRFIDSPVAHPAVMMRTLLFDSHGNYRMNDIPEDYELWLRWMEAGVKFMKSEKVLLRWRDHADRLTRAHPNYSEAAFLETKSDYLARWLIKNVGTKRSIIVCGSSPNIRKKIELLETNGIKIDAVTDVKEHNANRRKFVSIPELGNHKEAFILNLIARSDVREPIRQLLMESGRTEGTDFLMAG